MVFHTVHRTDATREKTQPRQNNEHNGAPNLRNLHRCESGQTITVWLGAIVVMSSVLMGSAYDMSVAWMHKQWADTAAQAACTAGAMDMLWAANNGIPSTPVTAYNFLSSTSGDCATSSSNAMCYYAKLNGYASPGLTSNAPSNDVSWSMSATQPTNSNSSPTLTTTPSNGVPAYMNVVVTENVPVTFMGIFAHFLGMKNSWTTIQVAGHCNCGLMSTANTGGAYYPSQGAQGGEVGPLGTGYPRSETLFASGYSSIVIGSGQTATAEVQVEGSAKGIGSSRDGVNLTLTCVGCTGTTSWTWDIVDGSAEETVTASIAAGTNLSDVSFSLNAQSQSVNSGGDNPTGNVAVFELATVPIAVTGSGPGTGNYKVSTF
jgi:hypothetical protein